MKNFIKFAIAAAALCVAANASAVIITSTTPVSKKKIHISYQVSIGVLQSVTIKKHRLASWCRKHEGCTYVPLNNNAIITAAISDQGLEIKNDAVAVPEPATLVLLGAGLLGMSLAARRRKVIAR